MTRGKGRGRGEKGRKYLSDGDLNKWVNVRKRRGPVFFERATLTSNVIKRRKKDRGLQRIRY